MPILAFHGTFESDLSVFHAVAAQAIPLLLITILVEQRLLREMLTDKPHLRPIARRGTITMIWFSAFAEAAALSALLFKNDTWEELAAVIAAIAILTLLFWLAVTLTDFVRREANKPPGADS